MKMKKLALIISLVVGSLVSISPADATIICPAGSVIYSLDNTKCVASTPTITGAVSAEEICPLNSALINGSCMTASITTTALPSKICPTGGTLNGANCDVLTPYTPTGDYSCPVGSTLSGSQCTTVSTFVANSTTNKTCPDGGTLSGSNCLTSTAYTATGNYTCLTGTLSGTQCTTVTTTVATVTHNYTCAAAYTLSGTNCNKSVSYAQTFSYSCSGNSYLTNGNQCYEYMYYYYFNATATPTCSAIAGLCYTVQTVAATDTKTYSCTTGTVSGTNCSSSAVTNANWIASCTAINGYCYTSGSYVATNGTVYSCPTFATLSGTNCSSSAVTNATYTATCSAINGYCYSSSTYLATTQNPCPTGGVLTGSNCFTAAVTTVPVLSYSGVCPATYTLNEITGICQATPFTPTAIPATSIYICTSYSQGIEFQTEIFTYNASSNNSYVQRICLPQITTVSTPTSSSYLCDSISNLSYSSFTFIALEDLTGITANQETSCHLLDDISTITDTPESEYISINPSNLSCVLDGTYWQFIACLAENY